MHSIIIDVFLVLALVVVTLGWLDAYRENEKLNAENTSLLDRIIPATQSNVSTVTQLQPHRGASRDRQLSGKARIKQRRLENRQSYDAHVSDALAVVSD